VYAELFYAVTIAFADVVLAVVKGHFSPTWPLSKLRRISALMVPRNLLAVVVICIVFISVVSATHISISIPHTNEQYLRGKEFAKRKDYASARKIGEEILQPLSAERLRELEKVGGMPVADFAVLRPWGRVIRVGAELNRTESKQLRLAFETLPWVECAGIYHPTEQHIYHFEIMKDYPCKKDV
jgi:hypothetical protein